MIQRELYLKKIRNFLDQPELVKIITGLRRSGKSVMLELIKEELLARGISKGQMLSYNFEDLSLRHLQDPLALHDHLKTKLDSLPGRTYLFLDELQEVPDWEKCINSLRVNSDVDIYITGSNAKMLAGEYATHLSGRYIAVKIYPFSFAEFCQATREIASDLSEQELFARYQIQGGMPFLTTLELAGGDAKRYLQDLYASVVIKDIMKRNKFRDVDLLERIIAYAMANISKTFSANSISDFFKSERRAAAPETIMNYLKGCESAYLFERIRRLDVPSKKMLQLCEKYYVADHGLREAVYGYNERDIELVLENMVCLELLRRDYAVTVGRIGDREIDFIATRGEERIYVQVCYLLAEETTIQREFGVLHDVPDNYPKYVVSMDEQDLSRDGVLHKNIREFLLGEFF